YYIFDDFESIPHLPSFPTRRSSDLAADVENAATAYPEAAGEEVDLALLRLDERVTVVSGFPPATGIHHVRAQPEPEEVVGQVVVAHDRWRRGAHRRQPTGAGHDPLGTGGC